MRLLLIRHGETPANVERRLATDVPGPGLTTTGEKQARSLVERLAHEPVEAVFRSQLLRTGLTIAPYLKATAREATILPGLAEIEAGDWEGRADDEAVLAYRDTEHAWLHGDVDRRMLGGPNGREFFARFDAAVDEIAASGAGCAIAVSHGAAIRIWAGSRAENLSAEYVEHRVLGNTGIVALEGEPGSWRCVSWEAEDFTSGAHDPAGDVIE